VDVVVDVVVVVVVVEVVVVWGGLLQESWPKTCLMLKA
jgi:hypothetical protein